MRRAVRLVALLAVVALVAGACGGGGGGGGGTKIGLLYDIGGRGDLSFNDSAAAGLDKASKDFDITVKELSPNSGGTNRAELLKLMAQQEEANLIIGVGFLYAETVCQAAQDNPDVNFADVDGFISEATANCKGAHELTAKDNVASLLFAEEQGSYLVGAAAALKSKKDHVGFIGGVDIDLIQKFEAGFTAGAQKINPDITVDVKYISEPPDFSGFGDPAKGKEIAASMYQSGADVIYAAAGGSGTGMFQAAKEFSDANNTKVWGIGVDSDQYKTLGAGSPELQPFVLTSMLKHVDVAVYETIKSEVDGDFKGGYHVFDLKADGVGYSTSGGFVDDIRKQLDDLKQQIIDGKIKVPTAPA
jgi:basic membrane protein A